MSPVHRAVRPALLLVAALLLGACGIPTTGVVESGEPATGIRSTVILYFVGRGGLVVVPRRIPERVDVEAAVRLLFQGPTRSEQRAGANTWLPRAKKDPTVRTDGAKVSVELEFDSRPEFANAVKALGEDALAQLACTAVSARHAEDPDVASAEVVVNLAMRGTETQRSTEGRGAACSASVRKAGAIS